MSDTQNAPDSAGSIGLPTDVMPTTFGIPRSSWQPTSDIDPDANLDMYRMTQHELATSCPYLSEQASDEVLRRFSPNAFSLLHFNVRGVTQNHRYSELESFLSTKKATIVGLCETLLTESNSFLYTFSGYNVVHKPRSDGRGHGGVSLLIREGLSYSHRSDLSNQLNHAESLFIELPRSVSTANNKVLIGDIYRTPSGNKDAFIEELDALLEQLQHNDCVCYLMGDFNLNLMVCDSDHHVADYIACFHRRMFFPLINRPTRLQSNTLLDHIFTNSYSCLMRNRFANGVILFDMSDHCPVFHVADLALPKSDDAALEFECQLINNQALTQLKAKLRSIDWSEVTDLNDVNPRYEKLVEIFRKAYFECIKLVTKKHKANHKPWISSALKKSIRQKNRLFSLSLKYPCDYTRSRYRTYKNRLNHLLRISERTYVSEHLEHYSSDMKRQWRVINTVIERKQQSSLPSAMRIDCDSEPLADPNGTANAINHFFIRSGEEVLRNNSASYTDPLESVEDFSLSHTMFPRRATADEILTIMSNLKDSSAGADKLKPKVIKEVRHEIIAPLSKIINLSISTGIFPKMMKEAIVSPVYKKGTKDLISNYRPISVLNVFAKILEKVVYDRLANYVDATGILYAKQFGFRSGHSTEMAVTEVVSHIHRALNEKNCSLMVSMDLSKAFDTINHEILCRKLTKYGVRGNILRWFQSYLESRSQRVKFQNKLSQPELITQGVPQGSNLGPLLFVLYINDFHRICDNCEAVLYADDCNVLFDFKRTDSTIIRRVNSTLETFSNWFSCNRLSLNVGKTHFLAFSGRNKLDLPGITINGIPLQQVSSSNFLGVLIDDGLSWKDHILALKRKLSRSIGILRKVSNSLPRKIMIQLYNSFFVPYLRYGITIWGSAPKTSWNPIYVLQKRAIKISLRAPTRTSTEQIFDTTKLLALHNLYKFNVAQFVFKFENSLLPNCFFDYFQTNSQNHRFNTRSQSLYRLPLFTTNRDQQSILFQGPKVWSTIPADIRNSRSIAIFKRKLKIFLSSQPVLH